MGPGIFLTPLPTLGTLFFLLPCLSSLDMRLLPWPTGVLSSLAIVSWRPFFSEDEMEGEGVAPREGKLGGTWRSGERENCLGYVA